MSGISFDEKNSNYSLLKDLLEERNGNNHRLLHQAKGQIDQDYEKHSLENANDLKLQHEQQNAQNQFQQKQDSLLAERIARRESILDTRQRDYFQKEEKTNKEIQQSQNEFEARLAEQKNRHDKAMQARYLELKKQKESQETSNPIGSLRKKETFPQSGFGSDFGKDFGCKSFDDDFELF